jgi:oxalate decarboxylase/phosphoglucose isomerase-like protein (cupin superfamily)
VQFTGGFYIERLRPLNLHHGSAKPGSGVFLNLDGARGVNDTQIVEIAPGSSSKPERHLYEEMVYIISGHGSTSVWNPNGQRQTFEWGPGSLFAIPLNAYYQHYNGSGSAPARYMAVTNAPTIMRLFHNIEFVLNNDFVFGDRFSGQSGYFGTDGQLSRYTDRRFWTSNFVADVKTIPLHQRPNRGAGGSHISLAFADNVMGAHISQFPVGTYKKAHRHGPGAHVVIVDGDGFSSLWESEEDEKVRCDWKPGSLVVPPNNWFHQHYNTGSRPARYLALKFTGKKYKQSIGNQSEGSSVSVKEGGWQIEYEDEAPVIHPTSNARSVRTAPSAG